MTCKACGQPFGCGHSDAEYQGVVPGRRRVLVNPAPRAPRAPSRRPDAPGAIPALPVRPRHDDGGAAAEPEREPA